MSNPIEILEHRIAPAAILVATSSNELLAFDSESPGTIDATIAITGLLGTMGETLVGIDFRPATGELYGLTVSDGSLGQLYQIDPITGAATAVGAAFTDATLTLSKTASYGFDFNPTVDRIRVVNSDGENFRLNPNTGGFAGIDTDLTAGSVVQGSAYDRSFAGSAVTTLFGIDVNTDQLVLQGGLNGTPSPNGGVITNVGPLGVNATSASFDIANGTGIGFAALGVGSSTSLYTINLTSGAATLVGDVGTGTSTIVGMAVPTEQVRIVNSKTATFTDVDGDIITVKITKGELTSGMFELGSGPNGGAYLRLLDLTGTGFAGTNVTITAKPGPLGGDKLVSVGYLNANGTDLGTVKISGDLSEIDAGDIDGGSAVKSLSVHSFGSVNPTFTPNDQISRINGSMSKFSVKRDFSARMVVDDTTEGTQGLLGSVVIGGSLIGGPNEFSGTILAENVGTVRIDGDIEGGSGESTGQFTVSGSLDSITVGGSIIGGLNDFTGQIALGSEVGKVSVKGSVIGSSGGSSGRIIGSTVIDSLTIGGSLIGGTNEGAGVIDLDASTVGVLTIKGSIIGDAGSTATIEAGDIEKLTVGKSVVGGSFSAGNITANNIRSVRIGGDLQGDGGASGSIQVDNEIGTVSIGGSVIGNGDNSGRIDAATIGKVTIGGSLVGGGEDSGSIEADAGIGSIEIGGDFTGNNEDAGQITVDEGDLGSVVVKGSIAGANIFTSGDLTKVVVGGDVSGSSDSEAAIAADGRLGSVVINGTLSDLTGTGNLRGDSIGKVQIGLNVDNSLIEAPNGIDSIQVGGAFNQSSITSFADLGKVTIGGSVTGRFGGAGYAVAAVGELESLTIGGSLRAIALDAEFVPENPHIIAGVIGSVKVGGDMVGLPDEALTIAAVGTQATEGTRDVAIGSLTVGGRVENVHVLGGYEGPLSPTASRNADAQIGKVTVGGDLMQSMILSGVVTTDGIPGNGDDTLIPTDTEVPGIIASIASITIKGSVVGTFGGTDGFGFVAEEIKAVSIGGVKVKLTKGASNDSLVAAGTTQDVRIFEVPGLI